MGAWRDTIAALSAPPAPGAPLILRLAGPAALDVAGRLVCASAEPLHDLPSHSHASVTVRLQLPRFGGGTADCDFSARCFLMRAPRSYTGDDVVELHLPSAPAAASALLRTACAAGARPAEPGEFTRRAFLSGRLTLDQAEAVARLVAASTAAEARAAARRLLGRRHQAIETLTDQTADLAALLEAALDFSDEDIQVVPVEQALEQLATLRHQWQALRRRARSEARTLGGRRVVLVGPPNAGKSSLLNRLARQDLALVSAESGTTRDRLEIVTRLAGHDVVLIDTAGLDAPTAVRKINGDQTLEVLARQASFAAVAQADLLLWVQDGSAEVNAEGIADRAAEIAARLDAARTEPATLLVLNKADLPQKADAPALALALESGGLSVCGTVRLSASTGQGINELAEALEPLLQGAPAGPWGYSAELSISEAAALTEAGEAFARAEAALLELGAFELAAADLRDALVALQSAGRGAAGSPDGTGPSEALLDRVFARFCIGK